MEQQTLFVLATSQLGMWLGVVSTAEYEAWLGGAALSMHGPRGFHMAPDEKRQRVELSIGPPYIGDSKQLKIALFPTAVEILGRIETVDGVKCCKDSQIRFQQYTEAMDKWRAAMSNIALPTPQDLQNLAGAPIPFPRK